jgi:TolB-like protein
MRIGASLLGIVFLALEGCVAPSPYFPGVYPHPYPIALPNLPGQTDAAVIRLMHSVPVVPQATTVLVTSAADLNENDLRHTSNFGRVVAEQIAGSLVRLGFQVPEVRSAGKLMFKDGGEFILSRDLKDLSGAYAAQFAVATTFTTIGARSYVNLKLIRLADNVVVAASEFEALRVGAATQRVGFDRRSPPSYIWPPVE